MISDHIPVNVPIKPRSTPLTGLVCLNHPVILRSKNTTQRSLLYTELFEL